MGGQYPLNFKEVKKLRRDAPQLFVL